MPKPEKISIFDQERREAWDRYAAAALQSLTLLYAEHTVDKEADIAADCAELADRLLEQRDKR